MFSRENRILSELIVSRGLASPEEVERRARELQGMPGGDLVEVLVSRGELDARAARSLREEAREIDALLKAELPEGKTLGEYRLVREIGRGGMGIVYEAEQPALGRRVALKVLPAGAALDEQLAIRFLREARAAARLNHPGIVPVFGTGREQGVLFFAMELVEGDTLAQRIERGPLEAREAARIAAEIARALQHAHEAGLVHRDVKPENVILGPDGRARLADFGLVHDLHAPRLTRAHYVLGTPAYTAPEQARDGPVDPRSDVYGVGAVLYAMLAGKPPFTGEVPAAVLGHLIHGPPPRLTTVAPGTPPPLVAICERAMARDRERRYPSAQSLAEALEGSGRPSRVGAREAGPALPVRRARLVVIALFVASAIGALLWLRATPRARHVASSAVRDAGGTEIPQRLFATAHGSKSDIALSPDGKTLAYVTAPMARLYLQREGATHPERVTLDEDPQTSPAWSPDGTRIAYCRSEKLAIVDLAAGAAHATNEPCGPMSWSPDGTRIVYAHLASPATRLHVLHVASGESRQISGPGAFWPAWSGGGRIAFVALRDGQYDVWSVRDDGSDARRVTNDPAREVHPAWSSTPGILYYGSNRDESPDLWQVRVDPDTGEVLSEPVRRTRGWFGAPFQLSIARERDRIAFVHEVDLTQSWTLKVSAAVQPIGLPGSFKLDVPFDVGLPQRSPVGEDWIVVARRGEAENLLRFGPRSGSSWLTDGSHRDGAPRWSPDGASVAFHSDRSGTTQIWAVRADGTRLAQVTRGPRRARDPLWSPDGTRLAYSVEGSGAWVTTLDRGDSAALLDDFEPWSWSADGREVAGTAGGIVVLDVASGAATRVTDYGERPSWVGEGLLFTHENRIAHWSGRGTPRTIWSTGPSRLAPGLSVAADGSEISFATTASTERVWVLDLDDDVKE